MPITQSSFALGIKNAAGASDITITHTFDDGHVWSSFGATDGVEDIAARVAASAVYADAERTRLEARRLAAAEDFGLRGKIITRVQALSDTQLQNFFSLTAREITVLRSLTP